MKEVISNQPGPMTSQDPESRESPLLQRVAVPRDRPHDAVGLSMTPFVTTRYGSKVHPQVGSTQTNRRIEQPKSSSPRIPLTRRENLLTPSHLQRDERGQTRLTLKEPEEWKPNIGDEVPIALPIMRLKEATQPRTHPPYALNSKTLSSPSTRGFPRKLGLSWARMSQGRKIDHNRHRYLRRPGFLAEEDAISPTSESEPSHTMNHLKRPRPQKITRSMRYGFGGRLQSHTPPAQEHDTLSLYPEGIGKESLLAIHTDENPERPTSAVATHRKFIQ